MTTHEILHFDATLTRKARLRTQARSPVSPPPAREATATIERFDATTNRRDRTRAAANGHAPEPATPAESQFGGDAPIAPSVPATVASPPPAGLDQFLIDFVVEQTGYPAEIIELDWDMEADLGIDSIKKAQLFGELREMFDLEQAIDPEVAAQFSLDQFRTLRDVLELLEQSGGKTEWLTDTKATSEDTSPATAIPAPQPSAALEPQVDPVAESYSQEVVAPNTLAELGGLETFLVDFVVEQTGYPPEIVELDADLEADLGIDSIKKAQLFGELREHFTIEVESTDRFSLSDFRTLRDVLNLLRQVTAGQVETVSITPKMSTSEPPKLLTPPPASAIPTPRTEDFSHVYRDSIQRGTANAHHIRAHLLDAADRFGSSTEQASLQSEATLRQQFSNRQWQELSGLAEGAGVDVRSIAAYNLLRDDSPANGDLPLLVTTDDADTNDEPELYQPPNIPETQVEESDTQVTSRRILRMKREPLLPGVPTIPELHGAAAILGVGPLAEAFQQRVEELGQCATILPETATPAEAVAELDRLWQTGPVTHLFIVTPCEPSAGTTFDEDRWNNRRPRGLQTPFSVCQHWIKRIVDEGLSEQASLVGVTSLGGDFGFCEPVFSAEGGGVAGLLKGMMIENWVNGIRTLPIKLIDAAPHNSPREVVDAALAELAAGTFDTEVTCSGGERRVVRVEDIPLTEPATKPIQRGGNWVFTGGGRGITAHVAQELASRFGLKAHLIGTAPVPEVPAAWRNLDDAGLKRVKLEVMTEARTAGENPVQAWKNIDKSLEIDETLQKLRSAGIEAHYYSCDVADRTALSQTLNEIRTTSGPIQGIIHGAGVGKDARFENKDPVKVEQCLRAKIDGALAIMELTKEDPLEYFAGFGSISGRFGANGHADYSLANDMLAKLIGWYRWQRPEVASVAFHWHAWGDVGMATRPEVKLALEMVDMQFMPAAEGVEHLIRELEAGAPEGEVLITDDRYRRLFFPSEMPEQTKGAVAPCPLLDRGKTTASDNRQESTFGLNPTTDPFLREHRLDDRPLLPIVVGMEMLAEAGSRALGRREGLTLTNLKAENGLRFHTDKPHPVTVIAEQTANTASCRLLADVVSRNGQLVEAGRPYLSGQVQAGNALAKPTWLAPPPSKTWEAVRYPARGSKFYLGEPLRGLRSIQIAENQAWGQIASQSIVHLAGPRRSVTGWIVPSAAIDACLYATGLLAWFAIEDGTALPESITRLSLGREPYPGERCLMQSRFKRREDRYAWFDFALTGANGDILVDVEDYRIVWLPKA
ncbi:MAG: SDR family NAD(P)-dependent oxidoreductase [Lacipirellulaceae bacterium]